MTVDYPFKSPIEVDPDTHFIFLLKGQNPDGVQIYAYVRVEHDNRKVFADALRDSSVEFGKHCEVIYGGEGEPTPDVQEWMREEFNFSEDGVPNLMEEVNA